jgi:hypothetical protein
MLSDGSIKKSNGTSFSGPIIAGALACLRQAVPDATAEEILTAVEQCASQASQPDSLMGYGIPDFLCALNTLRGYETDLFNPEKGLMIFPNPFQGTLTVFFIPEGGGNISASLYDTDNRLICISPDATMSDGSYLRLEFTSLENLPNGVYLLQLAIDGKRWMISRVVKM